MTNSSFSFCRIIYCKTEIQPLPVLMELFRPERTKRVKTEKNIGGANDFKADNAKLKLFKKYIHFR